MNKRRIIERLNKILLLSLGSSASSALALSSVSSAKNLQLQFNAAVEIWLQHDDSEPIQGIVLMMQTFDILNKDEASDLLEAISKVKKDGKE